MHSFTLPCLCKPGSSSDSDEVSLSDEDEKDDPDITASTPLAAFLSFKQEAEKRRASQVQLETTGKVENCAITLTELLT